MASISCVQNINVQMKNGHKCLVVVIAFKRNRAFTKDCSKSSFYCILSQNTNLKKFVE